MEVCVNELPIRRHRLIAVVPLRASAVYWNTILNIKKYIVIDPETALHAINHNADLFVKA